MLDVKPSRSINLPRENLRFREIFCLKGKGPITENRDVERHVLYKRTGDRVEHTAGVTGQT